MKYSLAPDIKKHIDDISKKYINTNENTVDYALMYVPSEAMYYEIINDTDIFDYCGTKRILPVSPLSFYAYLRVILMSFEGQKIQTEAKHILRTLQAIRKDFDKTEAAVSLLNKHLTNAYNQSSVVGGTIIGLGQKLDSIDLLGESKNTNSLNQ